MKTKKPKTAKLGKKKKRISDVIPSTSLPPLVDGQIRCFLRITVSKILWIILKPPVAPLVRLRWWGETSNGTLFHPRDSSHSEPKSVKTTARYAVRCGPRQFTSYLADMGVLVLEVLTKADHLPIGRVQINGISQLSSTYEISGFFTMISPTSEKLGELQVSLAVESLTDTCDSGSSNPTTDTSMDGGITVQSPVMAHTSRAGSLENLVELSAPRKSSLTSLSGKESLSSSASNTPRGRDHLYFQENARSSTKTGTSEAKELLNTAPLASAVTFATGSKRTDKHVLSSKSQSTKNLISVLLDRGSKLRNAMVVSAMKTVPDGVSGLMDVPSSPQCHPMDVPQSKIHQSPSGKLFHNLPESEEMLPSRDFLLPSPEYSFKERYPNTEATAINLLLGSTDSIPLHYWHGTHSPPESLSGGSSILDASELNDPHYDKSLLENLFYKDPNYESSISDFTSEDEELDTSKKKLKTKSCYKPDDHNQHKTASRIDLNQNKAQKIISQHPMQEGSVLSKEQEIPAVELNVNRLALLERICLARVIIETLKLPPDSTRAMPKGKGSRGKPPRPVSGRKCTYIVEYNLPVSTSSKSGVQELYMGSEITRVASSKVINEVVQFQQRLVFPVCFDGLMIEHWWNSNLVFSIYSKKMTQKKPILIGTASLALRTIIQSDLLSITSELPVNMMCDKKEKQQPIGPLKISVDLASDNKDFTSANSRLAPSPKTTYAVSSPGPKFPSDHNIVDLCPVDPHFGDLQAGEVLEKGNTETQVKQSHTKDGSRTCNANHHHLPSVAAAQSLMEQFNSSIEEEGFLLHVLLMVPDGKDFTMGDGCVQKQWNIYLKCKLFSTDEATRSPVSWSTTRPVFNFSLVAPITLTPTLLERMKNNMMIIEIWNKAMTSGQENLLGLVKLPLHQFYLSFRDPKISHLLLQAQYPVVAVDSYMPMMDVFTGNQRGSLRVLLAIGGADQIAALQKLKSDEEVSIAGFQRTPHFLDAGPSILSKSNRGETEPLMEHTFEMNVIKLKGLTPLQSTVWGEADCYVQYHFPTHDANIISEALPVEPGIILKSFRTATTLCVPDPVFNHCQSHLLLIPMDLPVQRILLDVCSTQRLEGGGGIQFEVWCRYYYPNVRDQVVARGILPLSKLCGMVTMQHHKEVGVQIFCVPLIPRTINVEKHLPHSTGLLDISVKYRCSVKATKDGREGVISSRAVTLSVQLLRASGLQAATRAVAEINHLLHYQSEVGVNTYVTIHISFLLGNEKRRTKVVARTFCPEFDHYSEFPCNLIIQKSNGESFSLAELLDSSEAVFTIYHQSNKAAKPNTILIGSSRDIELGSVRIPLADLLTKRTGISGWYAVNLPEVVASNQSIGAPLNVGGGLELSIQFAHPSDRERVTMAAEALEWKTGMSRDEADNWETVESNMSLSIAVPRIWLPLHCVLLAGHAHLDKYTSCYLRYKFYDREAVCTYLQKPILTDIENHVTVSFAQANTIFLKRTQSLLWYLKEERLEVQVWMAYGKDKVQRPHDTDRLIGYSFIDLSKLTAKSSRKITVSGIYPLFKRGASDLSGAALRFHITLVPNDLPSSNTKYTSERISYSDDDHDYECGAKEDVPLINETEQEVREVQINDELPTDSNIECNKVANEVPGMDLAYTFAVNVVVERAMHLSLKGCPLTEQTGVKPSCYVSYSTPASPTPIRTQLIENACSPIWEHQQQTRLPKELLLDPQQTLVFKVWHKADIDRVIGFASVDLSPLLSGFMSICGWYNITDFSGQCQGQLKVAITPLENIHHLREKRWTPAHKQPGSIAPTMESLLYETNAKYNSFPSHISKYSEQFISSSRNPDASPACDRLTNTKVHSSRHGEHMENVRKFHQTLQQVEYSMQSAGNIESLPQTSRTTLFSALRKNLSELDDIQRYFNQKLDTTPFSHVTNPTPRERANVANINLHHGSSNVHDNGQHPLENSNKQVHENHGTSGGLQKHNVDVTYPVQFPRDIEDGVEEIAENERPADLLNPQSPERENIKQCLPQFCTPGNAEFGLPEHNELLDKDVIDYQNSRCIVEGAHQQNHYESDWCSDEEYEEVVIQPKTLNDVTGMTDRTSPWSSILSDFDEDNKHKFETKRNTPESIGNGNVANEEEAVSKRVHDEVLAEMQNKNAKLPSDIASSESSHTEKSSIAEEIELDMLNCNLIESDCGSDMKLQERQFSDDLNMFFSNHDEAEDQARENEDFTEYDVFSSKTFSPTEKEETGLRITNIHEDCYQTEELSDEVNLESCEECDNEDIPKMHKKTSETETEDKLRYKLPDPVIIPNFFLPPSHLEASMRKLNVRHSFHTPAADPREIPTLTRAARQSNRQKPRLISKELSKEETERIAKIFAGHFTEKR
ncbi:C2 domain-containing protein 3 isoform X1 [Amblyraja radiata]|uniref:C2 domain-containing protein 3 isoform X1 n=1 Tax=Amblyraja radiata TaxID=386614 RepID=UPI001402C72C|nr:C2 domain-containing protein 3 isoform X1 [Amblyraja radiata]XP_032879090.1 C2 domain-containing protein 3 isoform X1 [Amblyraja radiata]